MLTFRIRELLSFHHRPEDGAEIRRFGVDQRKVIYVGLVLRGQTMSAAGTSVESIEFRRLILIGENALKL